MNPLCEGSGWRPTQARNADGEDEVVDIIELSLCCRSTPSDDPRGTAAETAVGQRCSSDHDDDDNKSAITADDATAVVNNNEEGETSSSQRNNNNKGRSYFFLAMVGFSLTGMAIAAFGGLAGGKVGLMLPSAVFDMAVYAAVDISTMIDDDSLQEQQSSGIIKRGLTWFALGLLTGTVNTMGYITTEWDRLNTNWQPHAILCTTAYNAIRMFIFVVMKIHHDRRRTVMKWMVVLYGTEMLTGIGRRTPYAIIYQAGSVLSVLVLLVGGYVVIMKIDNNAKQSDVFHGYRYLVGAFLCYIQWITLRITSWSFLPVYGISAALMLLQKIALKVIIPIGKRAFGDDNEKKRWSFIMPAVLLALELGPCLLLIRSDVRKLEFWLLLIMQETNSLLKNTGWFDAIYINLRELLGRPVKEDVRNAMEERRAVIAPCDNIGEIISPIVVLVAIGLESAFDGLPGLDRAPFLASKDRGILGAWRMEDINLGLQQSRGDAAIVLIVVLVVRVIFCVLEIRVRAWRKRDAPTTRSASSGVGRSDTEIGAPTAKKRRASMAVLYDRIAQSRDDAVHMQYMAGTLFALQPILFVVYAAILGQRISSAA